MEETGGFFFFKTKNGSWLGKNVVYVVEQVSKKYMQTNNPSKRKIDTQWTLNVEYLDILDHTQPLKKRWEHVRTGVRSNLKPSRLNMPVDTLLHL